MIDDRRRTRDDGRETIKKHRRQKAIGRRQKAVGSRQLMKKKIEEQVVQEFPYRCPYCEQEVSYDDLHLKPGENEIKCLSCKKKYIKLVTPSLTEGVKRLRRQ